MKINNDDPLFFLIVAASGTGKTTVIKAVLEKVSHIALSVSYNTRPIRKNEANGVDYWFVPRETFLSMVHNNEFLEHADNYGNYYGTHRSVITDAKNKAVDLITDVDVKGALQLHLNYHKIVSIFLLPPSFAELKSRITHRNLDTTEVIEKRIQAAKDEIQQCNSFNYVIINDNLNDTISNVISIIQCERLKDKRKNIHIESLLNEAASK